jgi:hypothetical protein
MADPIGRESLRFSRIGSLCQSNVFEDDVVANLGLALIRRAGWKFKCPARTEHHGGDPPWRKPPIDLDDGVAAAEKDYVDCEAHEEHVHPHERSEASVLEQHPGAGLEAVATQQPAALTGEATGILELRAQHGPARLIECPHQPCLISSSCNKIA